MEDIIEPTMDYDFSKLYLGPPASLTGGAYFTKIMYGTNKSLLIQPPKSLTKQGFIKSGKKMYADLMFDNNDTVFIDWVENLEYRCHDMIYLKKDTWFDTKLEKDDIVSTFTSPFKIFKTGKYYLLRVNVKPNVRIYDEANQVVSPENINNDQMLISILEIQGIKFTSRNFQIEIELKQGLIVSPDPFLDKCFIKKSTTSINPITDITLPKDIEELIQSSAQELVKKTTFATSTDTVLNSLSSTLEPFVPTVDLEEVNPTVDLEVNALEDSNIQEDIDTQTQGDIDIPEDPDELKEVDISANVDNSLETLKLKKANQVYYEMYQDAREKAKTAKKNAILAYLEMKNIKKTYMLDDINESDSEFEDFDSDLDV